jgi:hypothetical protein
MGYGMPILVSFCNVKSPATPWLAVFDPCDNKLSPLKLPDLPRGRGITGLTADEKFIYAATQHNPADGDRIGYLLSFSRKTFSLASIYTFKRGLDVHSMCWHDGRLLAVSASTDEVIDLKLDNGVVESECVYWSFDDGNNRADKNHLNGICSSSEGVVISGFGMRENEFWSSATSGFLMNLNQARHLVSGLEHPHSVMPVQSSIAFCESRKRAVRLLDEEACQVLPGYTRGMCHAGSFLFVGTSVGRRTSRSTGEKVENPSESGEECGECTINRLDPKTLALLQSSRLGAEIQEIYDLLAVDDVTPWPIT